MLLIAKMAKAIKTATGTTIDSLGQDVGVFRTTNYFFGLPERHSLARAHNYVFKAFDLPRTSASIVRSTKA